MLKRKRILSLCILVILLFSFIGCGGKKIDLFDIIEVKFTGLDGNGKANISKSFGELEDYIRSEYSDDFVTLGKLTALESSIEYTINKDSELSNGDEIEVKVTYNEDLANELGFNLQGDCKEVTVEGLKESTEIDLFSDIEVTYTGVSPSATVKVENNSSDPFLKSVNYSVTPTSSLKNGDKILVKAIFSENEAEEHGYIYTTKEKEITVENVPEYITDIKKIDEETYKKIDTQSKDLINATLSRKYDYCDLITDALSEANRKEPIYSYFDKIDMSSIKINKLEINKKYFLTLKEGEEESYFFGKHNNILYVVYEVNLKDNVYSDPITIYVPVLYTDIVSANGKIEVTLKDGKVQDGYESYDDLNRELITSVKDKYTCVEE